MFAPLKLRGITLLVGLAALAGVMAGCDSGSGGKPGVKRLVILINMESPYWDTARAGMEKAAADMKLGEVGLSAVMESNDATTTGQINKLRQFGNQSDIVAVAVSPVDASNAAVADEMRKLRKKGVLVLTIDNDIDRSIYRDAREFYIGTDNLAAGRELGLAAKALLPGGAKFVDFVARTGAQNAQDRMNGIKETVGDQFEEIDRMADEGDPAKARENVRHAITNFPDVKLLNGIYSYNPPAIVDVVSNLDKRKQLTILAFDAEEATIAQMGNGMIDAMVVQDPYNMGYLGVRLMKAMVEKDEATIKEMFPHAGEAEGDIHDTGIKVVVPDDSPLTAETFAKSTQFLRLEQFKEWLAKHGLKCS